MNQKISDVVADWLAANSVRTVFCVTGGAAMHLNDSIGNHRDLEVVYVHHEQAAAIAAEAYFRACGRPAAVLVTSGPGGTNALTGVLCAFTASIPMVVLSGQVRSSLSLSITRHGLRALGEQEADIVQIAGPITKFARCTGSPDDFPNVLIEAQDAMLNGRMGPVWIDIPIDIQASTIPGPTFRPHIRLQEHPVDVAHLVDILRTSSRPLLLPGFGVRMAGAEMLVSALAESVSIPFALDMGGQDVLPTTHEQFVGRIGIYGSRTGNFALQEADLVIAIGNRLTLKDTGYEVSDFARSAHHIFVNDIDVSDALYLSRSIGDSRVVPIEADARNFVTSISQSIGDWRLVARQRFSAWTKELRTLGSVEDASDKSDSFDTYQVCRALDVRSSDSIMVTTSGRSRHVGSQALSVRDSQRVVINHVTSPMGYDLPAAVGSAIAFQNSRPVYVLAGDGGVMMNLQELATIRHHKLHICILVLCNGGYETIRGTQTRFFGSTRLVGLEDKTHFSLPDFRHISGAFNIAFRECSSQDQISMVAEEFEGSISPMLVQVNLESDELRGKAVARIVGGSMKSARLDELSPSLEAFDQAAAALRATFANGE